MCLWNTKKDGLMCQVCATMDMLRWAKSLVIQEVENYDFTVHCPAMFKMSGSAATDLNLFCWLRHFYS